MEKEKQRELLTNFCNSVRDELLNRSERWPEEWDGHELRELVAYAFAAERSHLFEREPRSKRRRECRNDIAVLNLY